MATEALRALLLELDAVFKPMGFKRTRQVWRRSFDFGQQMLELSGYPSGGRDLMVGVYYPSLALYQDGFEPSMPLSMGDCQVRMVLERRTRFRWRFRSAWHVWDRWYESDPSGTQTLLELVRDVGVPWLDRATDPAAMAAEYRRVADLPGPFGRTDALRVGGAAAVRKKRVTSVTDRQIRTKSGG